LDEQKELAHLDETESGDADLTAYLEVPLWMKFSRTFKEMEEQYQDIL
jgi:hypothetical protein